MPAPTHSAATNSAFSPDATDTLEARLRAALAPNLQLVREIGAGGMARVFLAREPALKRLVAVKVLSGDLAHTEAGRARFEREAQAVAGLSHPNVVAVHMVGELTDGTPYFIMQYVDGRSMAERIEREGPLPLAEARRALGEVAAALAAAHKQGIIHRDVKPANILYEDATGRALVSDFGIAAVGREAAPVNTKLTATGVMIGTPQYMSPEQLLAEPVTDKTDIYSLGLLAHELLAGSGPFKGTSPHELIAAHLRDVPARLGVRRPDVDPELDEVIARCLEKDAAARPGADEVARRLTPGGSALLEWPAPGLEDLLGRLQRVSGMYMLGGATVTLMMLAIVAAGPRMNSALVSPGTLLLLIAAVAGVIVLSVAVARTIRASVLAARAIRSGYAWMTVVETMADVRGDTGNLIAGSREYAGLKPPRRDVYRNYRVWREVALLGGGLTAIPLLVIVFVLGSLGIAGWGTVAVVLLAPLSGLVVAFDLGRREHRAFAQHRKRRSVISPEDVARLAAPWYESFESVREGQRIGRGRVAPANAGRWGALAVAVALGLMLLVLVPLTLIGTLGPALWSRSLPKYSGTKDKIRIANTARPFALARDPRISPIEAGRAFYILQGQEIRYSHPDFPENPLPLALAAPPWNDSIPADVFTDARFAQVPNIPSPLRVMGTVRRGLSPAELAYLRRLSSAPHWAYYDRFARAPMYDYYGARYKLPFADQANVWALPIPRFAHTKAYAYASLSRAAYHLAGGRRDSAESVLRGTISIGFLFIDEGNTLIEQLIGAVLVGIGRQGMIDYFKAIGDPRGPALQARVDSAVAQQEANARAEPAPFFPNVDARDVQAVRAAIARTANDPNELRGVRLAMLDMMGLAPCTNLRELIFGPAPDVRETFNRQRATLARFPSDSAVIDMIERQVETITSAALGIDGGVAESASRVIGAALGNRRVRGCVALVNGLAG